MSLRRLSGTLEEARARVGLSVDRRILARLGESVSTLVKIDMPESVSVRSPDPAPSVTLRELYDTYMSGPTRDGSLSPALGNSGWVLTRGGESHRSPLPAVSRPPGQIVE